MTPGRIVLLNGASSAGKTTLARAFQDQRQEPWFHLALDQFRDGMPPAYRGLNSPEGCPGARGLNVVPVTRGERRVTEVRFGDVGQRMLAGMHRAIRAFALAGNDVVVDDLCLEPSILEDYLAALEGLWVLFVAVRAPLEVVQAREDARPGRFPGTAYSHFDAVHAHGVYDLEVDTGAEGPEGCARQISSFIEAGLEPSAFDRLRQSGGTRARGVQP